MRSFPRPMRTLLCSLALLPLLPALSACGGRINLTAIAPPCAPLVEASGLLRPTPWAPVPAAMTPAGAAAGTALSQGDLAAFADAQTGQLDKANNDKGGAGEILAACETRNAAAIDAVRPKGFLARLFGRSAS